MANKKKGRTAEVACGFEGDLAAAQARLRAFTEEACRVLDAEQLNFASVSIAANLDGGAGERIARMKAELTAERSDVGIWWRELTRANADVHGA